MFGYWPDGVFWANPLLPSRLDSERNNSYSSPNSSKNHLILTERVRGAKCSFSIHRCCHEQQLLRNEILLSESRYRSFADSRLRRAAPRDMLKVDRKSTRLNSSH